MGTDSTVRLLCCPECVLLSGLSLLQITPRVVASSLHAAACQCLHLCQYILQHWLRHLSMYQPSDVVVHVILHACRTSDFDGQPK